MAEEEIALRVALKDRQVAAREMGLLKRDVADLGDTTTRTGDQAAHSARGWSKLDGGLGALRKKAVLVGGALAVAGAAGGKALFGATQKASDLGETVGKVNQIFGGAQGNALTKWAKGAATSMGQSQQAALDGVATFGVFGKSAGLTGKELSGFAKQQSRLASDLASFGNTTPEEAIGALGAAFRGEAEPMRKFGVLLDDATLRQQALQLGLVKTTKDALTPQQKVLAAQAAIMKQTKDAQGDFQRTSGGLANQQRILAAQFDNVQVTIGKALLPALTRVVTFANKSAIPMVKGFIGQMKSGQGAGGAFAKAATTIGGALKGMAEWAIRNADALKTVGAIALAGVALFKTYTTTVLVVNAATKAWTALTKGQVIVQKALNLAMRMNPIGLVVTALVGLAAGLVYAYKKSETFRNIVNGAFGAVKTTITFVWNWIKNNWPLLLGILTGPIGIAVLAITKNWDRIKAGATAVKDWISDKFNAVVDFFRGLPARMGSAVSGLFDGIKDAFRGAINFVIDGWNNLSFSLPGVSIAGKEVFGGTTISTPDIDRLAKGGIVPATPGGRLAVIGEGRFNEAVLPMDGQSRLVAGNRVIPLPNTGSLTAPEITLDDAPGLPDRLSRPVHVHLEVDGREMGQIILDQFDQLAARR